MNPFEALASAPLHKVNQRTLVRVRATDTVADALQKMLDAKRGAAAVVDDDGLVGMFTEGDVLMKALNADVDMNTATVGELMTPDPVSMRDDDTFENAIAILRKRGFHHLPVYGTDGRPNGVISVRDLLAYVADHFPQEFLNLPPERQEWGEYGG